MRKLLLYLSFCFSLSPVFLSAGTIRHVGSGQTYSNLSQAVAAVQPGDTILIHNGAYSGGLFFNNLKGLPGQWITIKNAPGALAVFEGGSNAVQLTDPAWLHIAGLVFQHQTGNGFNLDDGGTYTTPAHHIRFENCTFRDMSASGNNDLLKLSGLDDFEILNCTFLNGAGGGSGIDMVGCHKGLIRGNSFENMGSNAIQAKGGTALVRIEQNKFKNAGFRAINLGGSTGLAFFRPDTAHYEAADLDVTANIFIGSEAPVAYVGSVRVRVANNTIYKPGKWVARILQETVDPDRFLACGDNSFINNIVFIDNKVSTEINIGPNTRPESFIFSNNLWFHADNPGWTGPKLPVTETAGIIQKNPLFVNAAAENFRLSPGSPAIGKGSVTLPSFKDFYGKAYNTPPTIGAAEGNPPVSGANEYNRLKINSIYPNPAHRFVCVDSPDSLPDGTPFFLYGPDGQRVVSGDIQGGCAAWEKRLEAGVYVLQVRGVAVKVALY